jgi:hypothetical protein
MYSTAEDLRSYKPTEQATLEKYEEAVDLLSDLCAERKWALDVVAFDEDSYAEWKAGTGQVGTAQLRFGYMLRELGIEEAAASESYAGGLSPFVVELSPDISGESAETIRSGTIFP